MEEGDILEYHCEINSTGGLFNKIITAHIFFVMAESNGHENMSSSIYLGEQQQQQQHATFKCSMILEKSKTLLI